MRLPGRQGKGLDIRAEGTACAKAWKGNGHGEFGISMRLELRGWRRERQRRDSWGKAPLCTHPSTRPLCTRVASLSSVAWLIGPDGVCCGFFHARGQLDPPCSTVVDCTQECRSSVVRSPIWEKLNACSGCLCNVIFVF